MPLLQGQIEIICGCMFSGKTEELIRRINRAEIANKSYLVYKPTLDNRYHQNHVVSHNQKMIECCVVTDTKEMLQHFNKQKIKPDIIAIDECQFFDSEIISAVEAFANDGIRVIIAGLDMDSNQQSFGSMPHLLAIAESVTKLQAICIDCGEPASFSFRFAQNENQVLIGNQTAYKPLCRNCFLKNQKQKNENHKTPN